MRKKRGGMPALLPTPRASGNMKAGKKHGPGVADILKELTTKKNDDEKKTA